MRVLLIEDDAMLGGALQAALGAEGLAVDSDRNGATRTSPCGIAATPSSCSISGCLTLMGSNFSGRRGAEEAMRRWS